jgi:hypothetical protein
MAKYFDKDTLTKLIKSNKEIVLIRNKVLKETGVDILDTDAISSTFIYELVSQYDFDYNINFARNGEDAKSKDILIEQKATRVSGYYTRTGRIRKGAGEDAAFQFHAMGDIDSPRYIFAARDKETLEVLRLYDISSDNNRAKVLAHLTNEKNLWLEKAKQDEKLMKRDIIMLTEKFILENLNLPNKHTINNCLIFRD